MKALLLFLALTLFGAVAFVGAAGVPNAISYQGRLTTSGGVPVADGDYLVKFIIYDASAGGTALWDAGFQTITTSGGLFAIALGAAPMPALPSTLFNDTVRYLGITVGVGTELVPRIRLLTSAYAFRAASADAAGTVPWAGVSGIPAGFADNLDNDAGGDITTVTAGTGLTGGGASGSVSLSADETYLQRRVTGTAAPGNAIRVINADGSIVSEPVGTGDITAVNAGTGLTGGGASGSVNLALATTITSSHTFDPGTIDFGDSTMKVSPVGITIGRQLTPSDGYLVRATRVYNDASTHRAYHADLDNQSGGTLWGAQFLVGNTGATDGGGTRYGLEAVVDNELSSASAQYAVFGSAGSLSKTAGASYGVYGAGVAGAGSSAYGVYGFGSGAGTTYAGYFNGDVHVLGTLSKVAGAFRIDHPLDPENKYLQHSFVESPDMKNIYDGVVTLDASGRATVTLPSYFSALNSEFRYQLTAIGAPAPGLYIAQEMTGNEFQIAGGGPGMRVSWQVTGIRRDAFASTHRIAVEMDKPAKERGTYLTPVEHGQPLSKHVNWEQIKEAQDSEASEVTREQ